MATRVEITDHWTDTGRKVFLAEVKVATDHLRNFPRLMIEVPDQGNFDPRNRPDPLGSRAGAEGRGAREARFELFHANASHAASAQAQDDARPRGLI